MVPPFPLRFPADISQIAVSSRPILPQLGFPEKSEPLLLGRNAWESAHRTAKRRTTPIFLRSRRTYPTDFAQTHDDRTSHVDAAAEGGRRMSANRFRETTISTILLLCSPTGSEFHPFS